MNNWNVVIMNENILDFTFHNFKMKILQNVILYNIFTKFQFCSWTFSILFLETNITASSS